MTRDEAIVKLEQLWNEVYNEDSDGYDYAKAIDMAIEVLEWKKGRWVLTDGYRCSQCNYKLQTTGIPMYCPNCGANMGERNE